jgi:3-hydroxybutyryl-CoA dehydratase
MSKLYCLEDLVVGATTASAARTITEADIVLFSGLSGDYSPLHTDEEWARANTPFGGRIAQGMLVASISYALRAEIVDSLSLIGWMEEKRRFVEPVFAGDTVRTVWTVKEVRPSKSRPQAGIAVLEIEVYNQHDKVVQTGYDVLMVNRRGESS